MSGSSISIATADDAAARLLALRRQVDVIRESAQRRLAQHATGIHIATGLSEQIDALVVTLFEQTLRTQPPELQERLRQTGAVIAVGGSGRGDVAPYSDVDLLFLHEADAPAALTDCVSQMVRDCWDAGLKLGHSVRTPADTLRMARQDPQFATTLVDARMLWGHAGLVEPMLKRYRQTVLQGRRLQFIDACIAERLKERQQHGAAVQQLEPDVKRSLGGLRDLHLMRWIGAARQGTSDLESLKLQGALSSDDARRLTLAHEYLLSVRISLHLAAGRLQDVLTRDDQLRIAEERGIAGTAGQRAVERFMQQYFEHSMAIAEIVGRFVSRQRGRPFIRQIVDFVISYRVDEIYRVTPEYIDVPRRFRAQVTRSVEDVLRLYLSAALHQVAIAPELLDQIKSAAKTFSHIELSAEAARLFLQFLGRPGNLGALVRSLYDTGVLEVILPAMKHVRCLLQFNQYHHYTVDEHTLRTIEAAESFGRHAGPLGQAYQAIPHQELLHLALLLHDAGKGYEEDHSEVGRRLAWEAAMRLGLPEHQRDLLVFLVHRHLLMATLAFRRDTTDPEVLLNFNYEVGSPDALRMLYVLTAADISAVGPDVWNDWKAELLTAFYDRCMIWLSGKSYLFEEPTRLQRVLSDVQRHISPPVEDAERWQRRLESLPTHYVLATPPARIARDLLTVQQRPPHEIHVESTFEPDTGTVEYRIIADENVCTGCFHKITGVLSAKRMEILNAQICTTPDGVIIDSYRVRDYDHDGEVPDFRREDVAKLIRQALHGALDVEALFRTRSRFSSSAVHGPVSNLPRRVVIDNETSDRYTIIDIFAHDRPGLLYRISRALFELQLSVALAKISTHFDQVVDVFYVTDADGCRVRNGDRLRDIRDRLSAQIEQFEQTT